MLQESEVPEGWVSLTIQDVCDINPPKPKKGDIPDDASVTFVPMPAVDAEHGEISSPEIRPFSEVRSGFTAFRDGDVIMAKITPCMENGKAAVAGGLVSGLGFGSTEFFVLRSNGSILPQYLFHHIRQVSFRELAESNMTGSVGQKRVPKEFIANAAIPLPPLAEQHRVVTAIEALFARLDATNAHLERVPGILKQFRQAVLAAACGGRLTEDWRKETSEVQSASYLVEQCIRERNLATALKKVNARQSERNDSKRPASFRRVGPKSSYKQLPDTWEICYFEDIAASGKHAIKAGPFGSSLIKKDYVQEGYKIYGQEQVIRDDPEYGDYYINEEKYQSLKTCKISSGDILISLVGTIGKVLILPDSCKPGIINPRLVKISLNLFISRDYIKLYLESPVAKRKMYNTSHGGTMEILNLKTIKELPIPLPPLPEQHEIVYRVEALFALADRIEAGVAAARAKTETMRQSILAQAFSGRLVPTEAELARQVGREYEPASALLERIRSEKKEKMGRKGVQSTLV